MCVSPRYFKRRFQQPGPGPNMTRSFPCGRCHECLYRKAESWVIRLQHEAENASSTVFVTLTYDNIFVPLTEDGKQTLQPRDLQLWLKRLRYELGPEAEPIKYYAVGEYGEDTLRPHYHLHIFNLPLAYTKYTRNSDGTFNTAFDNTWFYGNVHIGTSRSESFAYVANYVQKKNSWKFEENDTRVKEFTRCSLSLGLQQLIDPKTLGLTQLGLHLKKNVKGYVRKNGFKKPLPRFYRDKIFSRAELKALNEAQEKARENSTGNKYSGEPAKEHQRKWTKIRRAAINAAEKKRNAI